MTEQGEITVLQTLRMKGRATPGDIAAVTGEDAAAVATLLASLGEEGLVIEKAGRLRLSPEGRDWLADILGAERAGLDAGALEQVHEEFVGLNTSFKQLATDWQSGEAETVLEKLDAVHPALVALLDRLTAIVPRTSHYGRRFDHAITEVRAGETSWFLSPMVDSYHTVWFELHEELIGLTGRTRESEAVAGRAQ
jgi:DNA-binding MarR family transcriptional regulator